MRQEPIVPARNDLPRHSCRARLMHRRPLAGLLDFPHHRTLFPRLDMQRLQELPEKTGKAANRLESLPVHESINGQTVFKRPLDLHPSVAPRPRRLQPVNLLAANFNQGEMYPRSRQSTPWRGGRAVECAGLENRNAARHRGFESHPLPLLNGLPTLEVAFLRNGRDDSDW